MSNQLSFILLLPLILWSTFQGLLYIHAGQVTETVNIAAFEGQKEASISGYYDETTIDNMKSFLVDGYNMDETGIEVVATEITNRKTRGERMEVCISIPSPVVHVIDIFDFSDEEDQPSCTNKTDQPYYKVTKEIMSEYVPEGGLI